MNPTVLIIEDEKDINYLLSKIAESEGCRTVSAFSGAEGLLACERECPDLILLDLMLPGMDGFAVCRKLREKINIPILMVTARQEDIDKIRGLALARTIILKSPFPRAS